MGGATHQGHLNHFTRDMAAECLAMKGQLLALNGRSDEANKAFSAATQMHDTLIKAWSLWGDYLEHLFTRDPTEAGVAAGDPRPMNVGVSAMVCFLHACRHQNESKSRKYLAKVLWLLSFDDEQKQLMNAATAAGDHQGDAADMALLEGDAHPARDPPDDSERPGGHRRPDGVVPRELVRGGAA